MSSSVKVCCCKGRYSNLDKCPLRKGNGGKRFAGSTLGGTRMALNWTSTLLAMISDGMP